MMRPDTYPLRVRRITMRPTHMAVVFLTEKHAWKLRRPMRSGVMDFRSRLARHQDALQEWQLDDHFAPGICLGLAALCTARGHAAGWALRWSSTNPPQLSSDPESSGPETVLCMRRLPAAGMLDGLIRTHRLKRAHIAAGAAALANRLATRRTFLMNPSDVLDRKRRESGRILDRLRHPRYNQPTQQLDPIEAMLASALDCHRAGLAQRARSGCVRDGHGDLKPEHVGLSGAWVARHGPVFIDALEFDAGLRRRDTLDEIAGLAVSCEFLGSTWAHQHLRWAWQALDPLAFNGLWHLAAGRQALKRALHAAWHLDSPCSAEQAALWRQRSTTWLQLAREQLSLSLTAG